MAAGSVQARVIRTGVFVITRNGSGNTNTCLRVAAVICATIAVIAVLWDVNTSDSGIAAVKGAGVIVITDDRIMEALSACTSVNGTSIQVSAV